MLVMGQSQVAEQPAECLNLVMDRVLVMNLLQCQV